MKTIEEFARMLNGREYKKEITPEEINEAKEAGAVIIFGKSDDTTVICGAINEEVPSAEHQDILLTEDGVFEECPCDCIHSRRAKAKAKTINVSWCKGPYVWTYETDLPHVEFEIIDNQPSENLKFCRGIVFEKSSL